jgi:hypothetical protein
MSHPEELKQWMAEVSRQMPQLSKSERSVLGLYSFAVAMTQRCGLSTIACFLGMLLKRSPESVRQRLREWNYEAEQKRGIGRREVEVQKHFAALLRWILEDKAEAREVVLAMDVTYLKERFSILAISVVYRGTAIPVAWRVLKGNTTGEWHPLWLALLAALRPALVEAGAVYLLADRGLYSKRLFEAIKGYGWHPLMRIRTQGKFRRPKNQEWLPLERLARPGMGVWCQRALCFKGDPLDCTLLVQWDAHYDEPCLIATDLPPAQVHARTYALRAWIEAGFKDLKRGGLHWEQTHMTDPARVERLWLVLAVALLWLVRVGGQAQLHWRALSSVATSLSCSTLGWLTILVAALRHDPLPLGCFSPLDWHKAPL